MTRTIHKYRVQPDHLQDVAVPRHSQPVSVGAQPATAIGWDVVLWAIVDPAQPTSTIRVMVVGTGHSLAPGAWEHLGTVQFPGVLGAPLVFHVFVEPQAERLKRWSIEEARDP